MKNWEMPVMEELMIEETACEEGCNEQKPCGHNDCPNVKEYQLS